METIFITENYLKTYTGFNNNIDMSKVDFLIKTAFDLQITELLGTHFADWLLAKHQLVIAGTTTYSTFETKLVDLIQSTMAWQVDMGANLALSDQLQNSGNIKQSGDYQQPSGDAQVKYKMTESKQTIESYKTKLNNYLCNNALEFNEFMSDLNNDSLVKKHCKNCCTSSLDELSDDGLMMI